MTTRAMHAGKVKYLIDRLFTTAVVAFAWAREVLVNALEAGATRVDFAIERTGAASQGVYRRAIVDDGEGMTPDELVEYMTGYGVSGKAIGGAADNHGHGAKSSLLPRNHAGMIVVSKTVDAEMPSVIKLIFDPDLDDYGLEEWKVTDGVDTWYEPVIEAFADPVTGIDYREALPDWTNGHGTAVVLCGMNLNEHTAFGDTDRDEPVAGLIRALNGRFGHLSGMSVRVERPVGDDPSALDRSLRSGTDLKVDHFQGADWFVQSKSTGRIQATTIPLSDGVIAEVTLRDEKRLTVRKYEAPEQRGYIDVSWPRPDGRGDERFARTTHHSTYRLAGIHHKGVQFRTTITYRVPIDGNGPDGCGALMNDARTELRWRGRNGTVGDLPLRDWHVELAMHLPDFVIAALEAERSTGDLELSDTELARLQAEFASRWRVTAPIADPTGENRHDPAAVGRAGGGEGPPSPGDGSTCGLPGDGSKRRGGSGDGPAPARLVTRRGGVPRGERVGADAFSGEAYQLASYTPPNSAEPRGLVQLNIDHTVIRNEVTFWSDQYVVHLHSDIEAIVHNTYLTAAIAAVAHIESLRGPLQLSSQVVERWRDEDGLTSTLLGLWSLEDRIRGRIAGLGVGRRRSS